MKGPFQEESRGKLQHQRVRVNICNQLVSRYASTWLPKCCGGHHFPLSNWIYILITLLTVETHNSQVSKQKFELNRLFTGLTQSLAITRRK